MYWPTDTGPLRTLRTLKALPKDALPLWLRSAHAFSDQQRNVYISHPEFLSNEDLGHLALLAMKGYDVTVYPRTTRRLRIVIRKEITA